MNLPNSTRLNKSSGELVKKWSKKYIEEISSHITEQISTLEKIRYNLKNFENSSEKFVTGKTTEPFANESFDFHTRNVELLNTLYPKLQSRNEIRESISRINSGILDDIQNLEFKASDEYKPAAELRERGGPGNPFLRNTGDLFYFIRCIPLRTRNLAARLFKGTEKPLKPRQHTIHFQYMIQGFLVEPFVSFLESCTIDIQKKIIRFAQDLFEKETELINSDNAAVSDSEKSEKLPDLNELQEKIDGFYLAYSKTFLTLLDKSGTWEFPFLYIRYMAKRKVKRALNQTESSYRLWQTTFYAFYEDWRFREELFTFISNLKSISAQTIEAYSEKMDKTLTPILDKKRKYIELLVKSVPDPESTEPSELKHFFSAELYKLQKETRSQTIIADLTKTGSDIEKMFKKIEVEITSILQNLSQKSGVVRAPNYEKGIQKSEIYFFSPKEYIEFECIPPFIDKVRSLQSDFAKTFNEVILEFSDFDQITDFTLDTAISLVNTQTDLEETVFMFKEGLNRSMNIIDRISELNKEALKSKGNDLNLNFEALIEKIKKLDSNDNIIRIYSNLLKSKTIEQSKDKRNKIRSFLLSVFSTSASFIKKLLNSISAVYKHIRKKLKLDKAPVSVSSEISNYLADISRRIYKLPVIYRYLFENAPVKEVNLFLSRKSEFDKLDNAINNWKAGNYAATLVIGENGSGRTSMLQNYLKTLTGAYMIKYFPVDRFYNSESDYFELMKDVFEDPAMDSDQKILESLNKTKKKLIIIIDGIERLFLRKPGGFDCIQKLLSLIISTNEKALWICSVSLHASNYLNKTISLKENFDYQVELNNLSSEEIKWIILKRHRLSGYFIKYEDEIKKPVQDKKNKNRQEQLETDFFLELNRFAEGNISLSLYYWLESISEFTEKELYIKQFHPPDFSFLETLSADKMYVLLLIILHGKLSSEDYALIVNQSMERSMRILTVLKEDSIVLLKGNYYVLNGILYRHVIQLLKFKNIIH
ncbi:hypothetical protein ACFLT1_01355 [Bacteroidota bacterium]